MSLDVHLNRKKIVSYDGGKTFSDEHDEVYWRNITHNLNTMADAAGVYYACWRPEEIDCKLAKDLIPTLTDGLSKLKANPEEFKKHNPSNGWGDYEGLVSFVEEYLQACIDNPECEISISR